MTQTLASIQRLRWRAERPPLLSVILGDVRSLRTKMEELRLSARSWFEYWDSSLMVFMKTWLHKDIPSSLAEVDGFSLVWADRKGGGGGR